MKSRTLLSVVFMILLSSVKAQTNEIWTKAVSNWETSKNVKANYCVKSMVAGAKGYSSDYNTDGGVIEGHILYGDSGKFKIKVERFVNKGEEFKTEGNPTKDSFEDMMHRKENLIFAKENQKHINIELVNDESAEVLEFKVVAKIPEYPEFVATAYINASLGIPVKVINARYKKGKNTKGEGTVTITYEYASAQLVVREYLEEVKIEFFGNATFVTESYVFSEFQ
ncbi:MAG: hypothetical protein P1P88_20435 [Bacteroidales bacterium]|nr:hypothetical protein [Bacteroidales bacterium]